MRPNPFSAHWVSDRVLFFFLAFFLGFGTPRAIGAYMPTGQVFNSKGLQMYRVRTLYLLNPMTPKIQEALDQLVQAIQQETVAQFSSLLSGGQVGNGRSVARVSKARPKGGKRTSEEIAAFKDTIVAAIRKSPGVRSEQLAKSLGTTTKELQLPMLQLRDEKLIRMKGQKRAAQYFVK